MMIIEFAKLHGLGNDFVFINDLDRSCGLNDDDVRYICDRNFGIGADGVIMVRPSEYPDRAAYMHYINSDGTLAQMCGNGVRCFAKYLVDRKIVDPSSSSFIADTLAGPREIVFTTDDDDKLVSATVDMGKPILNPDDVPVIAEVNSTSPDGSSCATDVPISSPWGDFKFTFVSMGNPHAITFIDNWNELPDDLFSDSDNKSLSTLDLNKIGAFYEKHEVFPEKANIEFAEVTDNGILMRVFERGCGETLACGTGACATNVAAALTSRCGRENDVILKGGTLHIDWAEDGHVYMTGPAAESFSGVVEIK